MTSKQGEGTYSSMQVRRGWWHALNIPHPIPIYFLHAEGKEPARDATLCLHDQFMYWLFMRSFQKEQHIPHAVMSNVFKYGYHNVQAVAQVNTTCRLCNFYVCVSELVNRFYFGCGTR